MVTKTKKGAQLTFSRTRPKFGKIFVVIVLMAHGLWALLHCGHAFLRSGHAFLRSGHAFLCSADTYTAQGDFCQKGDKILVTKF